MAHPDHQSGMISDGMIRARMCEEIADLREALAIQQGCCDGAAAQDAHVRREREEQQSTRDATLQQVRQSLRDLGSEMERLTDSVHRDEVARAEQRLRIEHAVRLLSTTDLTAGEIAAACGFYDQSSFTRQFRAVLGLTPGAYRRSGTESA